jgi:hypothetical protein
MVVGMAHGRWAPVNIVHFMGEITMQGEEGEEEAQHPARRTYDWVPRILLLAQMSLLLLLRLCQKLFCHNQHGSHCGKIPKEWLATAKSRQTLNIHQTLLNQESLLFLYIHQDYAIPFTPVYTQQYLMIDHTPRHD